MEKEHQDKKLKSTPSLDDTPPTSSIDEVIQPRQIKRKPTVADLMSEIEGMSVEMKEMNNQLMITTADLTQTIIRLNRMEELLEKSIGVITAANTITNTSKPKKSKKDEFLDEFFDDYCAVCEDFGHVTVPECKGL